MLCVTCQPCLNDKTIRPCSKAMQDMFTNLKLSYTVTFLELTKLKFRTISGIYNGVTPFSIYSITLCTLMLTKVKILLLSIFYVCKFVLLVLIYIGDGIYVYHKFKSRCEMTLESRRAVTGEKLLFISLLMS